MTEYRPLRELCKDFEKYSDNPSRCDVARTNYLMFNKANFHYEELDEQDIINLRPFLKCEILARMEYLARLDNVELPEWFSKYNNYKCPLHENDLYNRIVKVISIEEGIDEAFEKAVNNALDVFKKRGIPWKEYDYTV